jgi:F420-non-reducing hydrogenase iron-sulfur subunit
MSKDDFEPNIVAFLCNWCSYAGADLAGTSRIQYPPNVKIIRVMCSGRVNPMFIVNALQEMGVLKKLLEYVGIDNRRVWMTWVSAAEGKKFADVISEVTENVRKLGPMKQIRRDNSW